MAKIGLEGLAEKEILSKVVWAEKMWNAKQQMDQEEEEGREIISISEESSNVEGVFRTILSPVKPTPPLLPKGVGVPLRNTSRIPVRDWSWRALR